MQVHPFVHLCDDFRRSFSAHHTVEYADSTFILAVGEMNVRRIMVALVEADDNSKEFANFWHNLFRYIDLRMQR